jgi:hypothetical protein
MNEEVNTMECETFKQMLHEMNRPGVLESAECERALSHAESCSRCAELLMHVEWLEFSLLKFAEHNATLQAPSRVEAALQQEFRRQKAARARKQIGWRLAALGSAAALFLAIGLFLRHRQMPSTSPASNIAPEAAMQAPQIHPAVSPTETHADAASESKAMVHAPRVHAAPARAVETEEEASFVRLPYTVDSVTLDGGTIVRVEMPRAALASYGLPVTDFGGNDRVPVDLVLSTDGTPEAIRLVSQMNPSQEF